MGPKPVDELEKEEVELLGGSASLVSEQVGKSRLGKVRMGHALAGRANLLGDAHADEAGAGAEPAALPKRDLSKGARESWLQPGVRREYIDPEQALLGKEEPREAVKG